MKNKYLVNCLLITTLLSASHSFAGPPSSFAPARAPLVLAAEDSTEDEKPSEAVIRKLAAMMPDQTFKRGEKTTSKGGTAPEGTTVYPIQILNADGSVAFDANFFQDASGKWALFDNFGNVARMPE